jgi:hypothetical protein
MFLPKKAGKSGSEPRAWLALVPVLLTGWSVAAIVALAPRLATQVVVAVVYVVWRWWHQRVSVTKDHEMVDLLITQTAIFEALFLMAAIWRTSEWLVLSLAWAGAYASVYAALVRRDERVAGVMAAAWGSL